MFEPEDAEPRAADAPGPRRGRRLLVLLAAAVALLIVTGIVADFWTDLLWFRSVGFTRVFRTQLLTKAGLFVAFALPVAAILAANITIAYRVRPPFRPRRDTTTEELWRMFEARRRLVTTGVAAGVGLLVGWVAAGEWRVFLQWHHGVRFGVTDPQFGLDVAFYAFGYPWWRFLLGAAFTTVLLAMLVALATHHLAGGLRFEGRPRLTSAAQAHMSLLIGLFVLLKAVAYWLDRYGLAISSDGVFPGWTGLKYTQANAVLPVKAIMASIAVICAGLFFVNVVRRSWLLPGIGIGLLLFSAVLIGGIYPVLVQQFYVRPAEADREAQFIARNIAATRQAYGVQDARIQNYDAVTDVEPGQLRADADTTASVRLLDPSVVSSTYQQLQQVRGFYAFADLLDVDRYLIDGRHQDTVVAVRELNLSGLGQGQRTWVNQHLRYTHGFGFVAARGNTRNPDGKPTFVESDIPPQGKLGKYEPRIYFGEQSPEYSVVGAPPGAAPQEIDYPDDTSPTGQRNNTYRGTGGVPVGSLGRRLLFSLRFGEEKILLSSAINAESRILYIRHPRERVAKVAPWLTLDSNAYPAVVGGRIVWIIDGYTTTNGFPYSTRVTLDEATADSLTSPERQVITPREEINYIRNSVKATVDAYDGTVTLYAWDDTDPVLRTWTRAFPGTVKPRSAIPPELLAHLRYPEDLFKVQREILARYHVTDPQAFYGGQDFWRIPDDPTEGSGHRGRQPAFYLTLRMPDQPRPTFSLSTTFVPANRPNLAAFMAVDAEPGEDYGTIRVLQLPRTTAIPGPGQVQNNFNSDSRVAQIINLLRRGESDVVYGNLLTLPVGGGLLYVEPIYVKARSGTSYPLLQKVLVGFGDRIAFENTLQEALDAVFQGRAGTTTGEAPATPPGGQPASGDLNQALADARKALADAERARVAGDWAAYGEAQRRLAEAIERATAAQQGSQPSPAPTP
ncbi:uncharacterized protein LI90_2102 [Carbonactinospora thermoautotrophica]|uniref:UPF0182 protein LI90_2102 n=2 Tax=Carbonactinospora thermoautotrophica TaxID=1469144 RepID=A0A132MTF0_9ACTN|nr:uncharacterized protein LI90_2102 [Carbonactinospora thermoautotrophica]